jgi:hypothetical protein
VAGISFGRGSFVGHIDEIGQAGGESGIATSIARGGFAIVRGWLVDRRASKPPDAISVAVGSGSIVAAVTGLKRPDVAAVYGSAAIASGFVAAVPIDVPLGACALSVRVRAGRRRFSVEVPIPSLVVAPDDPFGGLERRPGDWRYCVDGVFVGDARAPVDASGAYVVAPGEAADIRMWAIDAAALCPPAAIVARFGGRYLAVPGTIERADAAAHVGAYGAAWCGFSIPFIPSPVGTDQVEIYAVDRFGGYAHLTFVRARGAHPRSASVLPPTASTRGVIDMLAVDAFESRSDARVTACAGQRLRVRGWAIDEVGPRLSGGVELLVDGEAIAQTQTRLARPDVAALFESGMLVDSGFEMGIDLPPLPIGTRQLALRVYSARRDAAAIVARRTLRVVRARRPR